MSAGSEWPPAHRSLCLLGNGHRPECFARHHGIGFASSGTNEASSTTRSPFLATVAVLLLPGRCTTSRKLPSNRLATSSAAIDHG